MSDKWEMPNGLAQQITIGAWRKANARAVAAEAERDAAVARAEAAEQAVQRGRAETAEEIAWAIGQEQDPKLMRAIDIARQHVKGESLEPEDFRLLSAQRWARIEELKAARAAAASRAEAAERAVQRVRDAIEREQRACGRHEEGWPWQTAESIRRALDGTP